MGKIHLVQQHAASIIDTGIHAGRDNDEPEDEARARFELTAEDGRVFSSNSPPILATGFKVHNLHECLSLVHSPVPSQLSTLVAVADDVVVS